MHGECAEREPIKESGGSASSGVQAKSPEAESLLDLRGPKEGHISLHFYCLQTVHSERLLEMEIGSMSPLGIVLKRHALHCLNGSALYGRLQLRLRFWETITVCSNYRDMSPEDTNAVSVFC